MKRKVNDPNTWWSASSTVEIEDSKLGKLRISQWNNLHFRSSSSHDMSLIQVERLNSRGSGNKRRSLWLVWVGEQFLELKDIWSQYARRFKVDHWYRFAKQRLDWRATPRRRKAQTPVPSTGHRPATDWLGNARAWTLPSFTTAKQWERWSDLMPLMTWQLWLAKDLVEEYRLPWQSQKKNLTPGRVAQSILPLLIEMATPATLAKTRGKSPGWKTGQKRRSKKTDPIAKKSYSRAKKSKKADERGLGRGFQAPEINSGDSPSAFPHERLVQEEVA